MRHVQSVDSAWPRRFIHHSILRARLAPARSITRRGTRRRQSQARRHDGWPRLRPRAIPPAFLPRASSCRSGRSTSRARPRPTNIAGSPAGHRPGRDQPPGASRGRPHRRIRCGCQPQPGAHHRGLERRPAMARRPGGHTQSTVPVRSGPHRSAFNPAAIRPNLNQPLVAPHAPPGRRPVASAIRPIAGETT